LDTGFYRESLLIVPVMASHCPLPWNIAKKCQGAVVMNYFSNGTDSSNFPVFGLSKSLSLK
jgi:hypothetical protein